MKTIFIIGFMAAGKTTFAKRLANRLGLTFADLDAEVCARNKVADVKALIEKESIEFFRAAESEVLRSLDLRDKVIATGGGTPIYFDNLDFMKRRGVVVFLNTPTGMIYQRLSNSNIIDRPLLQGKTGEDLRTLVQDLYHQRLPVYAQAHITFDPSTQSLDNLVGELTSRLQ